MNEESDGSFSAVFLKAIAMKLQIVNNSYFYNKNQQLY